MNLEIILIAFFIAVPINSQSFYIKLNPKNVTVEEGYPAHMTCRTMPENKIVYRWKNTDEFLTLDDRRYIDPKDNRTLRFRHVDRHIDMTEYYCVAKNISNDYAVKSSSGFMTVTYMDPVLKIKLKSPKKPSDIRIGSSIQLSCNASANPPIKKRIIFWYFNGKSCCRQKSGNIYMDDDGILHLKNLTVKQSGFYHCQVTHTTGQIDSIYPFILHLYEQTTPRSKKMLQDPKLFSLFIKENKPVILKCPWNGLITWFRLKRLGNPLNYLHKTKSDPLEISQMKLANESYYVCQFHVNKSIVKEAVFRVSLAIIFDFNISDFSPTPNKGLILFRSGEDAFIRYFKDFTPFYDYYEMKMPNPIPNITWTFNNKPIPPYSSNSYERKTVYNNRHLFIENIGPKDEGYYEIKMANKAGERKKKFLVHIVDKPEFIEESSPSTINKMEGESFSMECKIKVRSRFSKVFWKINGHPIDRSYNNIILSDKNHKLKVTKARPENTGDYQCFVHTPKFPEYGNKPIKYVVRANLQFTDKTTKLFLEKKKPGIIPCPTKGFGKIVTKWYKLDPGIIDIEIKPPSSDSKILKNGSLKISEVNSRTSGVYKCTAESRGTNQKISKKINVTVGMPAKIVKINKNMTVQEGTRVYIHCQATGDPKPTILWMIKRSIYDNPTTIKLGMNKDGIRLLINGTLVIDRVSLDDYAVYTCVVTNSALISEKPVSLKVLTPAEYAKYLQGDNGPFTKGIVKTVIIVVSCAITYLALIIGLIVLCSLRMMRNKRNRAMNDKLGVENHQLISNPPLNHYHSNGGGSSRHQGSHNNTLGHPTSSTPKQQPSSSAAAPLLFPNQSNSAVQNFLPQPPGATLAPTTSSSNSNYYSQYLDANHNQTLPSLFYPTSGPNAVSISSQHNNLASVAPPPTPLESRSTTNSVSMYTRSQFSSSTNGGGPNGGSLGMSSMERLTYPRHELQTEGFLGKGEFGDVLLARARNIQEGESQSLVVVKSLVMYPTAVPSSKNDTQKSSTQLNPSLLCHEFHRQLDMLARLESDYVTRLLGICIEQDPCLLILEYCEWGDLKQFLRCLRDRSNPNMPPIDYSQKLSFCIQIATGMDAIANQNCVHKDLAARNILITPQLKIKVTHLGLCREGYHADYYQDGDRLLPLRWMPAESIIRGEFSATSDVWSYAVVLWEIFNNTNQSPLFQYTHEDILDTLASTYTSTPSQSLNNQSPRLISMYQGLEKLDFLQPSSSPNVTGVDNSSLRITNLVKRCLSFDPISRPNFTQILQEFKTLMTATKV